MSISVTAENGRISKAINEFNSSYHSDYFSVRRLAKNYLDSGPSMETASPLSSALSVTLIKWGAGKRRAPLCRAKIDIENVLNNVAMHKKLVDLSKNSSQLKIVNGRRSLSSVSSFATVQEFDGCLIDTLNVLSSDFFIGNTNVTYPMKSLLLLTGFMPAFDSQVKGGLKIAGMSGVKKTQYNIPALGSTDAKKICALPFYIADCISRFSSILNREVSSSKYPDLLGENGRIFDVLLFEQNKLTPSASLVNFHKSVGVRWYAI